MTNATAPADIRERIAALVTEADRIVREDYARKGYTATAPETHEAVYTSPKWCKIVSRRAGSPGGSVYAWVALADFETKELGKVKTGDIHKAESWKKPAKHARGSVFAADFGKCLTPYGIVYLGR